MYVRDTPDNEKPIDLADRSLRYFFLDVLLIGKGHTGIVIMLL